MPADTHSPTPARAGIVAALGARAHALLVDSVIHGDARQVCQWIAPGSVDLIFTDPPYLKEYMHLYGWLAWIGSILLKDGGFCIAMSGGLRMPEILHDMAQHMNFYWMYKVQMTGLSSSIRPFGNIHPVIARSKNLLVFCKGRGDSRTTTLDTISGGGNDKRFHHWGQDEQSARYFIDCFSGPGDLVLDPFCGAGTYPMVSHAIGRRFIGIDVDAAAIETSRARLRNPLYIPVENGQQVLEFAV